MVGGRILKSGIREDLFVKVAFEQSSNCCEEKKYVDIWGKEGSRQRGQQVKDSACSRNSKEAIVSGAE